jgi:thiamine-monophosphate kinase
MSERGFIRWLRGQVAPCRDVRVDIGHDAAVVRGRDPSVLKVDNLVESIHFRRGTPPARIGHKAMARPLSDFAAMGATPRFALVGWTVPRGASAILRPLFTAMRRTGEKYGVRIVGGDLCSHRGPLAISVSLFGFASGPLLTRRGARSGDLVCVTGALGGSILGKHLAFRPRLEEGRRLARAGAHAMIDISDGLLVDLDRMCEESGAGATLFERLIPVSAAARRLARRTGRPAIEHALTDGEDYELLAAVPEKLARKLDFLQPIGEISARRGIRMIDSGFRFKNLAARGWLYDL